MAQTWPVSRRRRALLKVVDFVGRIAFAPFRALRRAPSGEGSIRRILVIEPWNIGDVVLATPILSELRARFPNAHIAILAKPYARELLEESGLVDEVIECDLPWTAQTNKYRVTPAVLRDLRGLIRRLRRQRFDVTLDARMDIRSNVLAAAIGARRRIGYDVGGGDWLVTDALPSERDETHRIEDWLALIQRLEGATSPRTIGRRAPTLTVSERERAAAEKMLATLVGGGHPTIGYHPGGSHPGKRWPHERFEALIAEVKGSVGGRHVVFLGPDDDVTGTWPVGTAVLRPSLRELMALVSCCDLFVCNDSGPMHIADALGIPVVAIFEVGNPKWFGPSGPRSTVIHGELAGIGLSAAPLEHPPRNPVPVARVADAVRTALGTAR